MSYPELIGIGGKYGAGKDVAADYLVEKYGYVKQGMSDVLAAAVYTLNPIVAASDDPADDNVVRYADAIDKYGYTRAKELPEVRRLLQVFGTEVGREMFGENFWVSQAEERIRAQWRLGNRVVITGVRYFNELKLIDTMGQGVFNPPKTESWWVYRPGKSETGSHASENGVSPDQFHRILSNNGTIQQFQNLISFQIEQ